MTFDATKPADSDKLRLSPGYIRTNWAALETSLGASLKLGLGSQTIYIYANAISGETASLWSLVASVGDTLLAIKGGATYTTGGASAGTWTQPTHTLSTAEMPAHTHTYVPSFSSSAVPWGGNTRNIYVADSTVVATNSTGGGGSHSHGGTTYRPLARVGILITKS